jgi:putative ABC transport system permease protein
MAVGILVAAVSFILLTSAAKTSELRVRGSVARNFHTAYDILVRPRNSFTLLERQDGLVRDNYLSGIYGGITPRQYEQIKRIPGVAVAAPIANVGYVLPFGEIAISISDALNDDPVQLYRLRLSWIANDGLSKYAAGDLYLYYTRIHPLGSRSETIPGGGRVPGPLEEVVRGKGLVPVCSGFQAPTVYGPFDLRQISYLVCFSSRSPAAGKVNFQQQKLVPHGVGTLATAYFPIVIAGIDPIEEARLLHVDRTIVSGRYLREQDGPRVRSIPGCACANRFVPVVVSKRTYVDETLSVAVERLHIPFSAGRVPVLLAAGMCLSGDEPCSRRRPAPARSRFRDAYGFLSALSGAVVARERIPLAAGYRSLLEGGRINGLNETASDSYWQVGDIRYRRLGRDRVEPLPVSNPLSIWTNDFEGMINGGFYQAPQENRDVQFRRIKAFPASNEEVGGVLAAPALEIVGRYDPAKLPGFSPLSRVPLETYYPPTLEPANPASRSALHGRPLLPTQNIGDYIQQPPLMLTTLKGLTAFLNSQYFPNAEARQRAAPISVIRVRVAGVRGADALSRARIRTVAQLIHDRTGLTVDITAGSSPHSLLVSLPAGRFGRPPLLLKEGWVKKGVSVRFLNALDRKDLALFALVLLICGFFLANSALAAVRARRAEIGTLLTLGWSQSEIFGAILGEVVLIGVLAGIAGTVLVAILTLLLDLPLPLLRALLVLPLAVALACASGFLPAWGAARALPLDAVRPQIADSERRNQIRNLLSLALANLRRVPARTLLGATGLVVGVAALTILLGIEHAFRGTLVGTLLGQAIALQVRGVDLVAVALTIALAALSVADVIFLNLRERAAELVTLQTLGWSDREIAALIGLETLALGALGSLTGAVVGVTVGSALIGVPLWPLAVAALLSAAGGMAATCGASLLPLSQIRRFTPPTVLASE